MDRFDAMTVFVAVAERRSFAAAARHLRRTPSRVTREIAALEARLGVRLLHRTTRAVSLTDAGARFLARARTIVAEVADAEAAAAAERAAPTGRLAIAAPTLFGRMHVAPLLCGYLAAHPALTGELLLGDHVIDLVDEGVDAAVRIGELADSSLVARQVGATRRVLVASPGYLEQHGTPRRPAQLAEHALVHFTGLGRGREWRFQRDGDEERIAITPRFTTNSGDAAIGHAELGAGITMALAYQVADRVRTGKLRVILPGFEPPPLPIHVVYPGARLVPAKVRGFVELAQARGWRFVDL